MNTDADNTPVSPASLARRHEAGAPSLRPAMQVALVIPLITGICLAIIAWIMVLLSPDWAKEGRSGPSSELVDSDPSRLNRFPAPRLQVNPGLDLKGWRELEQQRLSSYGWVNRTAGVIHIPISRAMDLILERGFPTKSTNEPAQTGVSSLELIRQRSQTR